MLSKQMNNANKKLAINKLIPLLNDLPPRHSHFYCPCSLFKQKISYSLIFYYLVLHEPALNVECKFNAYSLKY